MTLVRPSAVVTLDGKRLTSAEGAIMRIRVRLGMGPAHDTVDVFCWPSSKLKDAKIGAALAVALGTKDGESDVWTGEVTSVRLTPDGVALEAMAKSVALSRAFKSQSFVEVTVADIVNELASAANVEVDGVSGDTSLSSYAVDDRRSAWSHINDLARIIGADVTVTAEGKLKFVAPSPSDALGGALAAIPAAVSSLLGGGSKGLRFGANVLGWRATTHATPDTGAVAAYGSASGSGNEKWHWLQSELSPAGKGPTRVGFALSTRDGASAAADAFTARSKRATRRANVDVVGDAALRPGQTTQISGIPGDAGGDLRIVAVEHVLDNDAGLVSRLTVELAS